MITDILRYGSEFARAIQKEQYDVTDQGILLYRSHALIGGTMVHWLNGEDRRVDNNTFTIEGLNYLLTTGMKNGTPVAAFYVAPFSGNVTPASTLTAATFTATLTEATAYGAATRPEYIEGTAASGSINNSASRAEITANATVTIWGAGLLSASAKSATTGTCMAAAKFAAQRDLVNTDVLAFDYTLTITPA